MNIKPIQLNSLPRLAWCARIQKNSNTVTVHHGSQVETASDVFADGAWNGPFNAAGFIRATILSGTGAALHQGALRVGSSTDKISPVFSIRKPNEIIVSNSPLFALTAAEETPDPIYPFYAHDLIRTWRQGLHCPDGTFRTASGTPLRIHVCTVMTIRPDLSVSFAPHPLDPCPENYEQYKQLMDTGVKDVFRNAQAPQRRAAYTPLAMTSRGYDSCATSALAAAAGCKESVTFIDSHQPNPAVDSGAEIARIMGMNCTEIDRWAYLKKEKPVDAEFAMFTLACNTPFSSLEDRLNRRMLISGYLSLVWDTVGADRYNDLAYAGLKKVPGISQLEFRLRVGYISFTPNYTAARHNQQLHAITQSDAMKPWWIGGRYDRPIARRLVEETGVPRDAFGIKKHAGGHATFRHADHFSPKALENYRQFVRNTHASVPKSQRLHWARATRIQNLLWQLPEKMVPAAIRSNRSDTFIYPKALRIPWEHMFAFQWAFDSLKDRYQLPQR